MDNVTLSKAEALKIYESASPEIKSLLEDKFGKENLCFDIMYIVRKFSKQIIALGEEAALPFPNPKTVRQEATNAYFVLDCLAEIKRNGKVLDWTNGTQKKWGAWFDNYQPGSGFRLYGFVSGWADAFASGGARLCVASKEQMQEFTSPKFMPLWNKFLNPNK